MTDRWHPGKIMTVRQKPNNAPKQSYSLGQMTGRRTGARGEITKIDFVWARVFERENTEKTAMCNVYPNPVASPVSKQLQRRTVILPYGKWYSQYIRRQ